MLILNADFMAGLARERMKLRLAEQIRSLRRERGWTQRETAKHASIAWRDVWRIENCYLTHITLKTLHCIARAFGLALDLRFSSLADALSNPPN